MCERLLVVDLPLIKGSFHRRSTIEDLEARSSRFYGGCKGSTRLVHIRQWIFDTYVYMSAASLIFGGGAVGSWSNANNHESIEEKPSG